jgi:hypothetical protein
LDRQRFSPGAAPFLTIVAVEGQTMTQTADNHFDIAATVASLSAEATALQAPADELRHELDNLNARMRMVSSALQRSTGG